MNATTITKAYGLTIAGDAVEGYRIYDEQGKRLVFGGEVVGKFIDEQDANHYAYDYQRKMKDPKPYIDPRTMERSATNNGYYNPRIVWPEHDGRMVRRDHLRPGDIAVSSHYGPSKVLKISQGGYDGQTTSITWEGGSERFPKTEIYPSDGTIEMLSEGWTR